MCVISGIALSYLALGMKGYFGWDSAGLLGRLGSEIPDLPSSVRALADRLGREIVAAAGRLGLPVGTDSSAPLLSEAQVAEREVYEVLNEAFRAFARLPLNGPAEPHVVEPPRRGRPRKANGHVELAIEIICTAANPSTPKEIQAAAQRRGRPIANVYGVLSRALERYPDRIRCIEDAEGDRVYVPLAT